MKTKTIYSILLTGVFILGMTSCSTESEEMIGGKSVKNILSISAVDNGFQPIVTGETRATTSTSRVTTFEKGDKMGMFVTNSSGKVIVSNASLTYDGTKWNFTNGAEAFYYDSGSSVDDKFFAYYPYTASLTGAPAINTTATITSADAFFSAVETAWTVNTDQSTSALYAASDLMIGGGTVGTLTNDEYPITFTLNHVMSLVEFTLPSKYTTSTFKLNDKATATFTTTAARTVNISPVCTWTDFTPYEITDNVYRYIVNPSGDKKSFTGSVLTSGLTTQLPSFSPILGVGKYYSIYVSQHSLGTLPYAYYPAAVGDLLYADGSADNVYTSTKTPVGVVVCTTSDYCESGSGYGHALVMALKNCTSATSTYAWRNAQSDAGLDKINTGKKMYNNSKSGYLNTDTIVNNRSRTTMVTYSSTVFPAFYQAVSYSLGAAPQGSTGWFVPSIGQWWKTVEECETYYNTNHSGATITTGLNTDANHTSTGGSISLSSQASNGATILNYAMQGHSSSVSCDAYSYSSSADHVYWASSEYDSSYACIFFFNSSNGLVFILGSKTGTYYVRPFLAF
jgi:hypothetical protein